jgi:tetratricopeptide (TPR) repeat protein
LDVDLRAYPGHYLPAFRKITGIQLRHWLYRDAGEAAGNISVPEMRNVMIGTIQATYAVRIKAEKSGKPHEAMVLLQNLELVLKRPPVQVKWNSPIFFVWKYCQDILSLQWGHLAEQFPGDALVRYNAGLSLLNFNEYEGAVVHLRAATESQRLPEPVRGTAFYNLGLALMNYGYIAEAETPLRAALEQSPPDLLAHCLLAEVYKQAGQFEKMARAAAGCPSHTPNKETVR